MKKLLLLLLFFSFTVLASGDNHRHGHDHTHDFPVQVNGVDGRVGMDGQDGQDGLSYDSESFERQIASLSALTGIPTAPIGQEGFGFGIGAHRNEQAGAIGWSMSTYKYSFKTSISKATSEKPVFNMGILIGIK